MTILGQTSPDLTQLKRRWSDAMKTAREHLPSLGAAGTARLTKVDGFGPNPGALEMFVHVPERLAPEPALVVALHGCGQNAAGFDAGTGWSTLADRYGFVLLLPQQSHGNSPQGCFNWYQPGDTTRGEGEVRSIREMIARAAADHGIPPGRVFVTGLSAGGGMAAALLATYPEIFAGGAIVAGLAYRTATDLRGALDAMFGGPDWSARRWGDLVRAASPHRGPWPRLSVWHGDSDAVVTAANATRILRQWTDLHGLPEPPDGSDVVDGFARDVWRDAGGREVIESYTIPGMGHGVPLAVGDEERHCGTAGAFMLNVGISSSYHIARFWGLTGTRVAQPAPDTALAPREEIIPPGQPGPNPRDEAGRRSAPHDDEWWHPGKFAPETLAGDVMDVIQKALRKAGLTS